MPVHCNPLSNKLKTIIIAQRSIRSKISFSLTPLNCCVLVSRSEEHTSELQSLTNLVCRLLLEKKKHYVANPILDHIPRLIKSNWTGWTRRGYRFRAYERRTIGVNTDGRKSTHTQPVHRVWRTI